MNNNKKVLVLIVTVFLSYLLLSIFSNQFIEYFPSFKNVNLIADVLEKKSKTPLKKKKFIKNQFLIADTTSYCNFDAFEMKNSIVKFDFDTLKPSLKNFTEKLIALSENKKVKIRIAWLGDSQIEGDFITQDIRNLFQNQFGQQTGVGFVPINSISSEFRQTAKLFASGELKTDNFKQMDNNSNLFFSGYSFFSNDLKIYFTDNVKKTNQITEKWLLYGKGDSISIKSTDSTFQKYPANKDFNRILVRKSIADHVKLAIAAGKTPIYGMSSEPESGVIVDNFSFRGITGVELKNLKTGMLGQMNQMQYYDLIVFQYGVNLMFKPDDTNYDYYYRAMKPIVKRLKTNLPKTDFLILGASDRAFNYNGEWKTAVGIDSLINIQARIAFETRTPFYNFYQSMGGRNSIVKWADSLNIANKDYIHFNNKGSKIVANMLYKTLMNDYKKAVVIHKNLKKLPKTNQKPSVEL